MSKPITRPEHLKHAMEAVARLTPADALNRLMRLDPVLGAYIAERQQCLVHALDLSPLPATTFTQIAVEQLKSVLAMAEMQRLGCEAAMTDVADEDHAAWLEAMSKSEPPFGVTH